MEQRRKTQRHILIVEDDAVLADGLCRALRTESIETAGCRTLREADALLRQRNETEERFSLILLDVNLPDGDGYTFLQRIKPNYDISVIILTANDMETDIVAGLEMGADDYITKPFSLAVLRARVEIQLKRVEAFRRAQDAQNASTDAGGTIVMDDYRFCFAQMLFYHGEEQVELSKTEQKLLRILAENRGVTLTREQLLDYIWSVEAEFVDENTLSVTVKRLRDKLGAQDRIRTVYGIGYRFE